MKKNILFLNILFFLIGMISCESFDYVYVDNKTFHKQLLYLKEGFVEVVLKIDPAKKDISEKYATAGQITKEKIIGNKTIVSTELIQIVLDIVKRNQGYNGKGWYPTFDIYIKYSVRFLYIIPQEKYLSVIFDFKNSIIFIEGRKFVFDEHEAKLLQAKLDSLLIGE
jgi:hypothetical protein